MNDEDIEYIERNLARFSQEDLWVFSLKEICKNLECSKVDFVLDRKRYDDFKRRFDYFVKRKKEE